MENGNNLKKKLDENKLLITLGPKPIRHENNLRSIANKPEQEYLENLSEPHDKDHLEVEDVTLNILGGGGKKK